MCTEPPASKYAFFMLYIGYFCRGHERIINQGIHIARAESLEHLVVYSPNKALPYKKANYLIHVRYLKPTLKELFLVLGEGCLRLPR